jgi:pimeloyl-ACP methyl ester carboxylesterase
MKKLFYTGLIFLLVGLLGLLALDYPLLDHQSLTLTSPEETHLSATYYPGSVSNGILILPGFGSDQHMMRSIVRDMTASGVHVYTFDYPGHGYSPGALEYDNASTDRLALQVQSAMTDFQHLSGLDASQIVWMGHSLGARVALQSAVLGPIVPAKLVLLGAQVNLGTNAQSEFFTGTTDNELDWVQLLGPDTPSAPVLLLSGNWEDILTVEAAGSLMTKLCGDETSTCLGESSREWQLFTGLFHNYEVYSSRVLTSAREWAFTDMEHPASLASLRIGLWICVVTGIVLSLVGLLKLLYQNRSTVNSKVAIVDPRKFIWAKLWLWLIAFPVSALVMFLCVIIPLPGPTFNLIYGGFLGGYGLLMFLLHWFGRMPGFSGRLRQVNIKSKPINKGWLYSILFNLSLFSALSILYRSGIGLAPPVLRLASG